MTNTMQKKKINERKQENGNICAIVCMSLEILMNHQIHVLR
jgi:hypothetical protein